MRILGVIATCYVGWEAWRQWCLAVDRRLNELLRPSQFSHPEIVDGNQDRQPGVPGGFP